MTSPLFDNPAGDQPLVSVIIPTYNRAYCLARAVDSALAQTHRKIEVLVIDDGSTDGTREMIGSRYGEDGRVRYLPQANRGVSNARNTGLAAARGEFAALLDSDDLWMPWKIELQVACMEHFPEVGMIWTDMQAIDPDGKVFNPRYIRTMYSSYRVFTLEELFPQSDPLRAIAPALASQVGEARVHRGSIYSKMIMGSLVQTSTVLVRRERFTKVGGFKETSRGAGEDYDFHLRTCREGPVAFADLATIHYQRGMPDRLTRPENKVRIAQNFLDTILPLIRTTRAEIDLHDHMIDAVLADAYGWIASAQFECGDMREARGNLIRSLRHDPRQPRALLLLASSFVPTGPLASMRAGWRGLKHMAASSRGRT